MPDEIIFLCSNVKCFQSFILILPHIQGNMKYIITRLISGFYIKTEFQIKINVININSLLYLTFINI